MKLNIRIIHKSNSRKKLLEYVLYALDDSRVKVIESEADTWTNSLKAYASIDSDCTHLLMLQDDVMPCLDFIKGVTEIIFQVPAEPINFFTNREVVNTALFSHKHWVRLTTFFGTLAYVLPVKMIPEMTDWIKMNCKPLKIDDMLIATYFFYNHKPILTTAPSLVQHLGFDSTTITDFHAKFNIENRIARKFLGYDNSPLDIDWQIGLKTPIIDTWGENSMFCDNLLPTSAYIR